MNQELMTLDFWQDTVIYEDKTLPIGTLACDALNVPADTIAKMNEQCPTLLLYGEKDTANKNASIELAELLKNVELKTIIGAGHEVNIESPQELAEILHAFYERMS